MEYLLLVFLIFNFSIHIFKYKKWKLVLAQSILLATILLVFPLVHNSSGDKNSEVVEAGCRAREVRIGVSAERGDITTKNGENIFVFVDYLYFVKSNNCVYVEYTVKMDPSERNLNQLTNSVYMHSFYNHTINVYNANITINDDSLIIDVDFDLEYLDEEYYRKYTDILRESHSYQYTCTRYLDGKYYCKKEITMMQPREYS